MMESKVKPAISRWPLLMMLNPCPLIITDDPSLIAGRKDRFFPSTSRLWLTRLYVPISKKILSPGTALSITELERRKRKGDGGETIIAWNSRERQERSDT